MPLFGAGFRCFFLGAAAFAPAAIAIWIAGLVSGSWALSHFGTIWHAHEMLFGYTLAVLAGFLTIRVSGRRLAFLFGLWLGARILLAMPGSWPGMAGMVVDLSFIPALIALREPAFWAVWKWPNGLFLPLLAGFWVVNLGFHLHEAGVAELAIGSGPRDAALDLFALLLAAIGGRLVPGYTGATLTYIRPPRRPALEFGSIASLLVAAGLHAAGSGIGGLFLLVAAALESMRLATWRPWAVRHHPLLWILHLGYGWLILGLGVRGIADLWPEALAPSAALHAFTVGAIGSLTIGMMTRLTLIHTRSALTADGLTITAFLLIQVAAAFRVAGPLALPDLVDASYVGAAGFWAAAFSVWLYRYARRLVA